MSEEQWETVGLTNTHIYVGAATEDGIVWLEITEKAADALFPVSETHRTTEGK